MNAANYADLPTAKSTSCSNSPGTVGITQRSAYWCLCRRRHKHQLRHAHAVELAREGVPVNIIQRQLGHTDLGTTSTYLQGIDPSEIVNAVHSRRPPMMPASAALDR